MQRNQLCLKDKQLFCASLAQRPRALAAYAFENIIMWSSLYDIFWMQLHGNLCIFFKDAMGCFLFLPPLGRAPREHAVSECFSVMNRINKNTTISRIENIQEEDVGFFERLGYDVVLGGVDYICRQSDMAHLRGAAFKKKRASADSFKKKYSCAYRPYCREDERECIELFQSWMDERKQKTSDTIYQRLLDDNFTAFRTALKYYGALEFEGRVLTLDKRIRAVTIGYPLDRKSFVVAFEVCDLSLGGIAQFIFRAFCQELAYPNINIMDDSGLPNLRNVKHSYRPYKLEKNFIARL